MSDETKKAIEQLYNEGYNLEDIADELGLDEVEVMNYCWNYYSYGLRVSTIRM